MSLNVALYYPWIYLTGGAERVIVELTGRSRHNWTIFTNHYRPDQTFPDFADRRVLPLEEVSVSRALLPTANAARTIFHQDVDLAGFDALLVVCEGLGDLMTFRNPRLPKVCCCLTPLRVVFDPVYASSVLNGSSALKRTALHIGSGLFRVIDRLAWKRYSRVIFISREGANRAVAGKLIKERDVEIVHPGIGFAPELSEECDPYFLLPGRIMWTKNLELGIKAFQRMRELHPDLHHFRLVIAGNVNNKTGEYFRYIEKLSAGCDAIEFRISPTDNELRNLYRRSYSVLFTAFNEDWGIVPIEGMAFGKPVVAVNRGGPRESIRHGVQGFLEEPEPDAFAHRMAQLAHDPSLARTMGKAGWQHAHEFTWTSFVEQFDQALAAAHRVKSGLAAPTVDVTT
jgi:glycosyltransferase involved in cell wall biosynthesis